MAGGGKVLVKEAISPDALRHKREYDSKYESTPERKKYRAELNQARRLRGIYGHGGPDMSHTKRGTIVEEDPHSNRARHFADRGTLKSEKLPYSDMLEEYHDKIGEDSQRALDEHIESIMEEMHNDPYPYSHGERAYEESLHELRELHAEEALREAREQDEEYNADYWERNRTLKSEGIYDYEALDCCTKVKMYMVDSLNMAPESVMAMSCMKIQSDPRYEKWSELAGCERTPQGESPFSYNPERYDAMYPYEQQHPSNPFTDWQQKNAGEPIDLAFQLLKEYNDEDMMGDGSCCESVRDWLIEAAENPEYGHWDLNINALGGDDNAVIDHMLHFIDKSYPPAEPEQKMPLPGHMTQEVSYPMSVSDFVSYVSQMECSEIMQLSKYDELSNYSGCGGFDFNTDFQEMFKSEF